MQQAKFIIIHYPISYDSKNTKGLTVSKKQKGESYRIWNNDPLEDCFLHILD